MGQPPPPQHFWLRTRVGGIWAERLSRAHWNRVARARARQAGPGDRPTERGPSPEGVLPRPTPRAVGGQHLTGRTRSPPSPRPQPSAQMASPSQKQLGPGVRTRVGQWSRATAPPKGARGWGGTGFLFPGRAGTTVGPPEPRTSERWFNEGKIARHPERPDPRNCFGMNKLYTIARIFLAPRAKRRVCSER